MKKTSASILLGRLIRLWNKHNCYQHALKDFHFQRRIIPSRMCPKWSRDNINYEPGLRKSDTTKYETDGRGNTIVLACASARFHRCVQEKALRYVPCPQLTTHIPKCYYCISYGNYVVYCFVRRRFSYCYCYYSTRRRARAGVSISLGVGKRVLQVEFVTSRLELSLIHI